ncbi:hypothetical protein ACFS3C_04295 [Azotobacter vinelandii]
MILKIALLGRTLISQPTLKKIAIYGNRGFFSVTVGGKTILRKERFQRMRGANFSDRWSSRSTRFVDYDLMLERRSGSLVVINANSAVFEGDKLIGRIQAVEIWVLVDGNWKVQSLAYDSLPENEW